jgi:8-oxo-dGTP pyrophosphatase MutT (NUDIX family)
MRIAILFLLGLLALPPVAAQPGIGCALRAGNGLVLVQLQPGRLWALPSGEMGPGENAASAAERVTFETTGLHAQALQPLPDNPAGLRIFACRTVSPLNITSRHINITSAPLIGIRTIQAGVFTAETIEALPLRFPAQRQWLMRLSHRIDPSAYAEHGDSGASTAGNAAARQTDGHWRATAASIGAHGHIGNLLGKIWLYLLTLPLIGAVFGRGVMLRMLFFLAALSLVDATAQLLVTLLQPLLADSHGATGFSMPSGHALAAGFFFPAVAIQARRILPLTIGLPLAAFFALWAAASQVWLGMQGIADVTVGLALGALLVVVEQLQRRHEPANRPWLAAWRLHWAALASVSFAVGVAGHGALPLPFALSLGVLLAGPPRSAARLDGAEVLWLLAGMLILGMLARFDAREAGAAWQTLLANGIWLTLLGSWIAGGAAHSFTALGIGPSSSIKP